MVTHTHTLQLGPSTGSSLVGPTKDKARKCFIFPCIENKENLVDFEKSPLDYFTLFVLVFIKWSILSHVSDVIISQKGSNGDGKLHFFGRDYIFTCSLCTKIMQSACTF